MTTAAQEHELRVKIVDIMQAMDARGLNRGTSGNVSARCGAAMLVTPSGIPAARLKADQIVVVQPDGSTSPGALAPSSEWRMHWGILAKRRDIDCVVHCHSRYATILACANKPIPPLHYMVAVGGGADVPVAPYATFGSDDLARVAVSALHGRFAALLANHGQIAIARVLEAALSIAEQIEEQAALYWGTLAIGGPTLLSDAEMKRILERFAAYGQSNGAKLNED